MIIKSVYDRLKDKKVKITEKGFGLAEHIHEGVVVSCCFGQGTEMFLELNNGSLINTQYISKIDIID